MLLFYLNLSYNSLSYYNFMFACVVGPPDAKK